MPIEADDAPLVVVRFYRPEARFALFISLISENLRKKGRCETRILRSISENLREFRRSKKCETRLRTW